MAQFSRTFTHNVFLFAFMCIYSNVCYSNKPKRKGSELGVDMCTDLACPKMNFQGNSANVPMDKRVYSSIFGKRFHGFIWKRPFDSLASGLIGKRDSNVADLTLKNKRFNLRYESEIPQKKFLDHLASGLVGKKSEKYYDPNRKDRRSFDTLASGLIGKRRLGNISLHRLPTKLLHLIKEKHAVPSKTYHKRYFDPLSSSLIG